MWNNTPASQLSTLHHSHSPQRACQQGQTPMVYRGADKMGPTRAQVALCKQRNHEHCQAEVLTRIRNTETLGHLPVKEWCAKCPGFQSIRMPHELESRKKETHSQAGSDTLVSGEGGDGPEDERSSLGFWLMPGRLLPVLSACHHAGHHRQTTWVLSDPKDWRGR